MLNKKDEAYLRSLGFGAKADLMKQYAKDVPGVGDIVREKIYAAEENVGPVRFLVVVLNFLTYIFLSHSGHAVWLAYAIIAIAAVYSLAVILLKPYKQFPILLSSYFTTAADAALITLFLLATGGYDSPYYPLWYISIIAVAYRYSSKATFVVSIVYSTLYLLLLFYDGSLFQYPAEIGIRIGYILLIGMLAGLLSKETFDQIKSKLSAVRSEQEMRKSRKLLEEAQKIAHIGSWRWDVVNDTVEWSDELYKIFGKDVGEPVNYENFLMCIHPDDRAMVDKQVNEAYKNGKPFFSEHRIICPDGKIKFVQGRGRIAAENNGGFKGMTGTAQDITEKKRSEEKLKKLVEELEAAQDKLEQKVKERTQELEKANQELKEFAYVVSHDLKAPLRGIQTISEWLEKDFADSLNEEGKQQLSLLHGRVKRMENLINGILQYYRMGNATADKEKIDVQELLKEIIDMINPPSNIKIKISESLPAVHLERTPLLQVFQNLISNAVKYMDKPEGVIEIGSESNEGEWQFYVKDNGPGIKQKHHEEVFKLFNGFGGNKDSTGIGLALVKKIIKKKGGNVWLESEPGKGCSFHFSLPKS